MAEGLAAAAAAAVAAEAASLDCTRKALELRDDGVAPIGTPLYVGDPLLMPLSL